MATKWITDPYGNRVEIEVRDEPPPSAPGVVRAPDGAQVQRLPFSILSTGKGWVGYNYDGGYVKERGNDRKIGTAEFAQFILNELKEHGYSPREITPSQLCGYLRWTGLHWVLVFCSEVLEHAKRLEGTR